MRKYSIISAVYGAEPYITDFLRSLADQSVGLERLEIILVDDGSPDESAAIISEWCRSYPDNMSLIRKTNGGVASARNAGLAHATSSWVTFPDPDDILPPTYFEEIDRFLERNNAADDLSAVVTRPILLDDESGRLRDAHPLRFRFAAGDVVRSWDELDDHINLSVSAAVLNRGRLRTDQIQFDSKVVPTFEDGHFFGRFVARAKGKVGFAADAHYHYRKRREDSSLVASSWTKRSKFLDAPKYGYLALLRELAEASQRPPLWAQNTVLYDLQWLFRDHAKVHARTRWLLPQDAQEFHAIVEQIMSYIDEDTIRNFNISSTPLTISHAFLSYKRTIGHTPIVALGRYDKRQRLLDLRYIFHGDPPAYRVLVDGEEIQPVTAKRQSFRYFGKDLFQNQIIWIRPPKEGSRLEVQLDARPAPMVVGGHWRPGDKREVHRTKDLSDLRRRRRAPGGRRVMRTPQDIGRGDRVLRWLATSRFARSRFGGAWLFMDRDTQADDNAEHLYRWVKENKPEVRAYFLLRRDSHDWTRLKSEGFRLLTIGSLRWKLAILNAAHMASSHLDAYVVDPLPRRTYGDLMIWRFTFLQHGVITNDMSNWLNMKFLDRMVTSTPAEHASIAGDDTPYKLTDREVRRTGLARHDALLKAGAHATSSPGRLVLMPTWRNKLVGNKEGRGNARAISDAFFGSHFALRWKQVLHDDSIQEIAAKHGLRISFMPHLNMQPYLDWFDASSDVEMLSHRSASIQEVFADTALLITDYSSVAFDLAFLQRPILYYQFDRREFFGGDHLWRPGYFDYSRDGFGPVVEDLPRLRQEVDQLLRRGAPNEPYLSRMRQAFPERDGNNRERIFQSIVDVDRKLAGLPPPARADRARGATAPPPHVLRQKSESR